MAAGFNAHHVAANDISLNPAFDNDIAIAFDHTGEQRTIRDKGVLLGTDWLDGVGNFRQDVWLGVSSRLRYGLIDQLLCFYLINGFIFLVE
ncbi:hypothetical protein D3C76_1570910 [compost metagenome]